MILTGHWYFFFFVIPVVFFPTKTEDHEYNWERKICLEKERREERQRQRGEGKENE